MGRSTYCFGLLLAAALAACGGSQPAATAPAEPGAAPAGDAAAAPAGDAAAPAAEGDMVWKDDMPTKDKGVFMKKKVVPALSKTFQDYDGKKYASFGCKTCHGPAMKPKPADFLPELHFKGGKMAEADTQPAVVKFMHEQVVPSMAGVLGKEPYDPKTNAGFGCMGCHKVNM